MPWPPVVHMASGAGQRQRALPVMEGRHAAGRYRRVCFRSVKIITLCLATASALALVTASADAALITFEGYAPNNGAVGLPPDYTASGYTLSFTGYEGTTGVVVFGAGTPAGMIGNSTANLAWNTSFGSSITLTGPASFDLLSVDLGGYVQAPGDKHTNITLTGHLFAGGTISTTFANLLGGTTETVNWTGLQSVVFTGTYYGTMDNIVTGDASAPEPGTMLLLGAGIGTLVLVRRRRKPLLD